MEDFDLDGSPLLEGESACLPPPLLLGEASLGARAPRRLGELLQQQGGPRERGNSATTRERGNSATKKRGNSRANPYGVRAVKAKDPWHVYYESGEKSKKAKGMESEEYATEIQFIGSCQDWKDFEVRYSKELPLGAALWLFKKEVKPMWEDEANQGRYAGKWVIPTKDPEASRKVMCAVHCAIEEGSLEANGVLMTHKFGQAMSMTWMHGESSPMDSTKLINLLGDAAAKGIEDVARVRFKSHYGAARRGSVSKSTEKAMEVGADSDYDISPTIGAMTKPPSPSLGAKKPPRAPRSPQLSAAQPPAAKSPNLPPRAPKSPTLNAQPKPKSPSLGAQKPPQAPKSPSISAQPKPKSPDMAAPPKPRPQGSKTEGSKSKGRGRGKKSSAPVAVKA